MNRSFNRHLACFHYGKKGFTLLELLVVIAVLGALVAVAIPAIAPFIGSGKTEAAQTELDNVRVAATAALAKGTAGSCTECGTGVSPIQLKPSEATGGANDPRTYLINDTAYKYHISTTGAVTQGDKV